LKLDGPFKVEAKPYVTEQIAEAQQTEQVTAKEQQPQIIEADPPSRYQRVRTALRRYFTGD